MPSILSNAFILMSLVQLIFVFPAVAFQPSAAFHKRGISSTARPVSLAFSDLDLEQHYRDFSQSEESNPMHSENAQENGGVYKIMSKTQYTNFLKTAAKNRIVVLKIFAPWCRACKALAPKFSQITHDEKYNQNLPIVWAELSVQHNKELVEELAVDVLPTVQFYVDGKLEESFVCGPNKSMLLKRKLAALVNANVDAQTRQLKRLS